MKIDKEQLLEQIVEKSGLDREFVAKQLARLIKTIHDTAEKGKALEVKGFGMFFLSSDGDLVFEPAETFATEVNYRYAGMEPVELEPGKPAAAAEPSATVPAGKSGSPISAGEGKVTSPDSSLSAKTSSAKGAAGKTHSGRSRRGKKERDPVRNLIYTVITIAILAVTLVYVLDLNQSGPVPESVSEQPAGEVRDAGRETDATPESGLADRTDFGEVTESDRQPEAAGQQVEVEDEPEPVTSGQPVPQYGLHGEAVDLGGRYYAIIIHSMSNKFRAEEAAEQLGSEGYRETIQRVENPEHGTMWRVGVGQFESVEQAQAAAEELPSELRQSFFIGRIQ